MEYLIGSLATLCLFLCAFALNKMRNTRIAKIRYSQSHIHKAVGGTLPTNSEILSRRMTQSKAHDMKTNIKVILVDGSAYWVKDNAFYTAYLSEDGLVDKDTTRVVDTITMSGVELDKMLFIMDRLREGIDDDRGGTGR